MHPLEATCACGTGCLGKTPSHDPLGNPRSLIQGFSLMVWSIPQPNKLGLCFPYICHLCEVKKNHRCVLLNYMSEEELCPLTWAAEEWPEGLYSPLIPRPAWTNTDWTLDLVPTNHVLPALTVLQSENVLQMFLIIVSESDGHRWYCTDITRKAHLRKTLKLAPLRSWWLPGHRARGLFHRCFVSLLIQQKAGETVSLFMSGQVEWLFYTDTEIRGVYYMKRGNIFF